MHRLKRERSTRSEGEGQGESSTEPPIGEVRDAGAGANSQDGSASEFDYAPPGICRQNMVDSKMPFPWKVQIMLDDVEREGKSHIVSWLSHGRSFRIHRQDEFVDEILPNYFNQSKISSFTRQLYIYQFQKVPEGPDKGAFMHPRFIRGDKNGALHMKRNQERTPRKKKESKKISLHQLSHAHAGGGGLGQQELLGQDAPAQQQQQQQQEGPAGTDFFNWSKQTPEKYSTNNVTALIGGSPSFLPSLSGLTFPPQQHSSMINAAPGTSRRAAMNQDNSSIPTQFIDTMLHDRLVPSRRTSRDAFESIPKGLLKGSSSDEDSEKGKRPKLEREESLKLTAPETLSLDDDFDYEKLPGFFDNPLE